MNEQKTLKQVDIKNVSLLKEILQVKKEMLQILTNIDRRITIIEDQTRTVTKIEWR